MEVESAEQEEKTPTKISSLLLQILLERASDKFPGVRAKALSNIAQLLEVIQDQSKSALRREVKEIFFTESGESPSKLNIAMIAKRRTNDEKCTVRYVLSPGPLLKPFLLGNPPCNSLVYLVKFNKKNQPRRLCNKSKTDAVTLRSQSGSNR